MIDNYVFMCYYNYVIVFYLYKDLITDIMVVRSFLYYYVRGTFYNIIIGILLCYYGRRDNRCAIMAKLATYIIYKGRNRYRFTWTNFGCSLLTDVSMS